MIIVAVSGGIDSMVLLDLLYHQSKKIIIAHVNYQKRIDSYKDAQVIKDYINGKDIIFEELVVKDEDYNQTNFQSQARHIRYNFFEKISDKYQTKDIYVAHHKDDYLETYLFKKNREGLYSYVGIKEINEYRTLIIHRPLLNMYKKDIIQYASVNSIDYHEDSSNKTLDYERNRIRAKLTSLTKLEKDTIYNESLIENAKIEAEEKKVKEKLYNIMNVEEFKLFNHNEQRRWLYYQIKNPKITHKYLDEIIRKIYDKINFYETFLDTTLVISYDIIYVLDKMPSEYSYFINNDSDLRKIKKIFLDKYNYKFGNIEECYPYEIRSIKKNDLEDFGIEYKKFRRKLIKNKVPFFIRKYLPVLIKNDKVKKLL